MLDRTRVTRTSMLVAVLLAAMMLGLPSALTGDKNVSVAENAAALDVERMFTVGTAEISVATLNPFSYTMVDEYMAIWMCSSTLLTYDVDMNRIGDLATSWSASPDGLTWTFKIVNNAYFVEQSNPTSTAHQLTVDDIIYTYYLIQNTDNNLHFYFPGGAPDGGTPPTIAAMNKISNFEFEIVLTTPYAPFVGALTSIPIVPKYYWEPKMATKTSPTQVTGVLPIGTGPFYYALPGLPTIGEVVLNRNPIWCQEANKGWQIHVDVFKLKQMGDSATAWMELQAGNIDCMMGVPPTTYTSEIIPGVPDVIGFAQSTGFVYEYNLNQMTTEMRETLAGNYKLGENSQILQDPVVKEAMAMAVNKPGFIETVLNGLGTVADSLVPDVNPWYYHYGSSPGEIPVVFDTLAARHLLWDNGWKYDIAGNVVDRDGTACPLYGYFDGDLVPLEFRFYTLTSDPEWTTGGTLMMNDAAEAGIKLNLELKSVNQLNSIWYAADYDAWLWDWMFTPLSEPSTDVLSVATTMEIGSWSDIYWSNATYDELYNRSLTAMDPTARRQLTDEMQRMLYEEHACQLISYRKELYAVSTKHWSNFGDWEDSFFLMPDQGYPYLYMMLSPSGSEEDYPNSVPSITSLAASFEGTKSVAITFTASATDSSTLQYQWYFGDGSVSGWLSSPTTTHPYAQDGYYKAYFAARETTAAPSGAEDYFITSQQTSVKVIDISNSAPYGLSIGYSPSSFDSGDVVTFTATASDLNAGDILYYSWSFGDTYTANGQVVTHQFKTPGAYTVTLSVDDMHVGTQPRPVTTTQMVSVAANLPPTISVPDFTGVPWKQSYTYTVTASDPELDPMRFTWVWGDGSTSVTTSATTSHTYNIKTTYTLRVFTDDLTGLSGHNVSDTGSVQVVGANKAPTITSFTVSNATPYIGQTVVFTAAGKDLDGDPLTFTFTFGDGTSEVYQATPPAGVDATFVVPHEYSTPGTKTAYLLLFDGTATKTSTGITIGVIANYEPVVTPLEDVGGVAGSELSFLCDAFDPDWDDLTYTWNFGDGSPLVVGNPVVHTYAVADVYPFTVYVDDGHSHNVSSSAVATIAAPFSYGMLRVTTNPAVPGMIYLNGDWMSRWGLDWVKLDPGTYTLSFGDVLGFVTPADQEVVITAGEVTNFQADYIPMGSLRVITEPAMPSTVYVNGIPRNDWGFWNYVPAGTYTVSFGAVANYAIPAPQTVEVTVGGFQQVIGTFVSSPGAPGPDPLTYGMLRVTTNPAVPTMVYLDGEWMSHWGLNWVKVPVGMHTLSFSDVFGAITPEPLLIEIVAGMTTSYDAVFELAGTLRVMTNPPVPSTVYIDGIARNDWGLWVDVPAGTYVVSFGDVPGLITPAPQTVTVVASGYTEVTGIFA